MLMVEPPVLRALEMGDVARAIELDPDAELEGCYDDESHAWQRTSSTVNQMHMSWLRQSQNNNFRHQFEVERKRLLNDLLIDEVY